MRVFAVLFCVASSLGALIAASYFGAMMNEGTDEAVEYAKLMMYLVMAAEAGSIWSAYKLGSEKKS